MTDRVAWIFLALCAVGTVAASLTRNRIPLPASIVVAAVLRIAFAALTSQAHTPRDARIYFRTTAEMILQGKDPVHDLPGRQWNFLELMPVVHALELRSGLPWVYAVKIAPILADLVLVWLVARFATSDGRTRALQYALNPLSLLVVSLHGQVEPVALVFALTGVLLVKKGKPVLGGVFLGAAVATKTWPVVILLAVLPVKNLPRTGRIVAGSAIVPILCLALGVIFLDTQPFTDLGHMASYSSYIQYWTWSATLIDLGYKDLSGYGSPLGALGSVLIVIGVATTLYLLRHRPPEARVLGVLCAILLCTAGFGTQYLMWVLPLIVGISGPARSAYVVAAGAWSAIFYLSPFANATFNLQYLRGLSWLPAVVLLVVILEQVRLRPLARDPQVDGPPEAARSGSSAGTS